MILALHFLIALAACAGALLSQWACAREEEDIDRHRAGLEPGGEDLWAWD